MDVLMLHPKKRKLTMLSQESMISDKITEVKTSKVVNVQQEGTNIISVMGNTFVNPYAIIQSHGEMACEKGSCVASSPHAEFVPSKKSVQSVELSRKILNDFLSSHEGYIDKNAFKAQNKKFNPRSVKNLDRIKINYLKRGFSADIAGRHAIVSEFLIDPIVVDSVRVNKESSEIDVMLKNATCSVRKDDMSTPSKTVLFCSENDMTGDAYKLKSYLATYKEQMNTARGLKLGRDVQRFKVSFKGSPVCHTRNGIVCCKMGDEDEICY